MIKTILTQQNKSKVEYVFDESDIREALINHFKIKVGVGKNWFLDMQIEEAWEGPATISLCIRKQSKEVCND